MIEIRPIRSQEGDSFLRLLCDVFGLDYERARAIFFTEPMFDLNRKWALFDHDQMVSILTTVPLIFGWGKAFGIAGVATRVDRRSEGLAGKLLAKVVKESKRSGEDAAFLFARETGMYSRLGFELLDDVVRGDIRGGEEDEMPPMLSFEQVSRVYARWADENPHRLRRDERRWSYWKWNLRVCTPFQDGYLCTEAGLVREAVLARPAPEWPLGNGAEWLGLRSMAEAMEVPLMDSERELYLMGLGARRAPEMFMTDQF